MKKLFAVIIVLLVFFLAMDACDNDRSSSEEYKIIENDKMVDVMVDVHIIEATLRNKKISGDSLKKLTNNYYQTLFDKYNISRQDFDSSFAYYEANVGQLNNIYEKVIERLNKKQRKLEQIQKEQREKERNRDEPKKSVD
ncbi:MAG: DUF4296 domain-containing protein [Bacteroidales bacterium]|nr:DUF4296 domain-containing protein [Bacteroidales bacterium]MCF8338518.1 DUF4296 domain-containing protein [Bacteroidales bacterium]